MSGSGFRGRGFGPRGARTNGPANSFNGPRFPHPNFTHSRPPHRLPGPEKWVDGPGFPPWQQNKNFGPRPHYRGNAPFRPNNRGRGPSGRGIVRFSGPGRPPAPPFCTNFIRNHRPRAPLLQEAHVIEEDKAVSLAQIPLLGSEEERQQKITETADKLKQKLSSITEEDLTNFWEDDLSILPNKGIKEGDNRSKIIPALRHEPPELDLTFTDFRDIGRVDCNNLKFDNVEDTPNNDDVSITFESEAMNTRTDENEVTIIHESTEERLNVSNVVQDNNIFDNECKDSNVFCQSDILLENDNCQQGTFHELSDAKCNLETLHLQCNNLAESQVPSNSDNINENIVSNVEENKTDLTLRQPTDVLNEKSSLELNDTEESSVPVLVLNDQNESEVVLSDHCTSQVDFTEDQNALQVDFSENQNVSQLDFSEDQNVSQLEIQNTNTGTIQDTNLGIHQNDQVETDLHQIQDDLQTNVPQEEVCQTFGDVSDSTQNNSFNPSLDENIQASVACDSISPMCSSYTELHKPNNDPMFNAPPHFQPRGFNTPPRFAPRIPGPRCRWTFQKNGKNAFFRGSQRLPFHGNRMPPPRHVAPFASTDLIPVPFDPRAPPPFTPNLPALSHDAQHHASVPFSSNDLPPSFDPSAPPPNMRPAPTTESSVKQEVTQTVTLSESRNQARNAPPNNMEVMQPPPAFDPRGPPPNISNVIMKPSENLPEFNPQQPPPKIHKRDESLQPPPIFDPRLSSQERSNLLVPLSTSGPHMIGINRTEPSQMPGFSMAPIAPNFSQPPPMNIPPHQAFIPNLQVNFQPVLPQPSTRQLMVTEFTLPPPPMNITNVPPPPPRESSLKKDSIQNQSISMDDDGLEDMQEAMEFAKQIMNMTEEMKNSQSASSELPEKSSAPLEIPVPNEETCSVLVNKIDVATEKKQRKKENKAKKNRQNIVCGPEFEKQDESEVIDDEQNVQNEDKSNEDILLTGDQIRPKVVFNLNSKTKVIQKTEEWHRSSVHVSETRDLTQLIVPQNSYKERMQSKRHSSESRKSNTTQNKRQQKESNSKTNPIHCMEVAKSSVPEKSNNTRYHQDYIRDLETLPSHSFNELVQKSQRSKKNIRKVGPLTPESSWKNRVISRFLKMSKNDICNMVNNSSLRKFDIAMKHLVKERRPSLSVEMRNTEDEKMKEYDREEFMNQLNAMLDSGAVVGITDLPTEFIHHLSEVLQLEPMPCELESSERENAETTETTETIETTETTETHKHINEVKSKDQPDASKICAAKYLKNEIKDLQSFSEYSGHENTSIEHTEHKVPQREESVSYRSNAEFNLNISRDDTSSSKRSLMNKSNPEIEITYKKQQPLFNEADLDDILLQVTERTKNPPSTILTRDEPTDSYKDLLLKKPVIEVFECNAFSRIPTKTVADLDDIFSAGIARAKSLSKSADPNISRTRKSSSEDRNTFRSERYERWSRKEREEPDTFRNLTKEEWEAKYGSNAGTSSTIRKTASTSAENLSKDNRSYHSQRYCSSDSPMRNLSLSPLTRDAPAYNLEGCMNRYNEEEELQRTERSGSSSDISTSSSSDSDEETVSPNVTKLLKVIKEKEKIAKKKSLNETIRDEVTAEIEKKWKEKSKHKERKSRKREKRKRDKREKRKKEKKKRRKRNSHSITSKSSEQSEGFRLLTEDEIKKEVVVKQEPPSTVEETVSFSSGTSNSHAVSISTNKLIEPTLWIESQSSQMERQVPAVICDKAPSQVKGKPTIISMTVQPKTKAQLKQMPESTELEHKQIVEKSTEVTESSTSNALSVNIENMRGLVEKDKDSQVGEGKNEKANIAPSANTSLSQTSMFTNDSLPQTDTSANNTLSQTGVCLNTSLPEIDVSTNTSLPQINVSTNNTSTSSSWPQINVPVYDPLPQTSVSANTSLPDINVPLNITEPSCAEVTTDNTANTALLASNITNTVPVINASTQPAVQKAATTGTTSTEAKSGYRKIDIKAYKERALQRRLKEEAKLKEVTSNSVLLTQELQHTLPINKTANETEKTNAVKEATDDASKAQMKDPRLAKNRPARTSWEDPQKEVKTTSNPEREHSHRDILQINEELSVTLKSTSESLDFKSQNTSTTRKTDSDSNPLKDSVRSKDRKSEAKSVPQEKVLKEEEMRVKAGYKLEEKKSKKPPVAVESTKFKNIRSEGGKELKLKKEKTTKLTEQKKKSTKSKSSLIAEKHSKHLPETITEGTQKPSTVNTNSTIQSDIEKASSCDSHESNPNEKMKENVNESTMSTEDTVIEHSFNNEVIEEQVNIPVTTEEEIKQVVNDNEETKIEENQQIISETITEALNNQSEAEPEKVNTEGELNLLNSKTEENNVTETEENSSKNIQLNIISESIPAEKLNDEEDSVKKEALLSNQTSSIFVEETDSENKSEENTVVSIANSHQVKEESHFLVEDLRSDNEENIIDVETVSNSTPPIEMNPEALCNDNTNSDTLVNNAEESEVRSPDSSGSPFKGFLAESIEDDILKASQLINIEGSTKDAETNETEKSEKLLEMCLDDGLNEEAVQIDKDDQNPCVESKEIGDDASTSLLMEEQTGSTESDGIKKTILDNFEPISNVEPDAEAAETEEKNVMEEPQTYNSDITREKVSPGINLDNQDTFNANGEPFIVLDEYIDDTDGKSIEKLSVPDLDLEECIARDAEMFSNNSSQEIVSSINNMEAPNFNVIQFNELSEVFDKNNEISIEEKEINSDSVNIVPSIDTVTFKGNDINTASFELNTEPETTQEVKSVLIIPEIPIFEKESSSEKEVPFDKDITQELIASQESCPDKEKTEQRVLPLECSPVSPEATCCTIQTNSSVPVETAATKSLENLFSVTASTSESKTESSELNEETDNFEKENDKALDKSDENKIILTPSEEKEATDKEIRSSSTLEHKSKDSHELAKKEEKVSSKSQQKENDETLHKIKNKSKMKHKQHKKRSVSKKLVDEAVQSDTVKVIYPNTKEGIMARMIEIDVEIHKLMTEKMTLYQMLTNDALPTDKDFQQNNTLHETKEAETTVVRPRTPSALMSQLIQNIETSPVTNQCAKTTENLPLKESVIIPAQLSKTKVSKPEHNSEKKTSCVSTRGSDHEEFTHHTVETQSPCSRKKKKPKWAIKWKDWPETINNASSMAVEEEKQANDGTKSILKKISTKQKAATEQDSDQTSTNDIQSQEDSSEMPVQADKENSTCYNETETPTSQTDEKTVELTECQLCSSESDRTKALGQDDESTSQENIEDTLEALNDTDTVSSVLKPPDNRTSERSSIYSDDSTWDSLLQNSSIDEHKKPTTGLALLEETYRKEIALSRRRTETRKRKRNKSRSLSQAAGTLTPEEEELPLSTLHVKKKSYHKKKSQNSLDQQIEKTKDDPQLWTNVDEIINAVAENRTEDLYGERSEGQPSNIDNQSSVPDSDPTVVNEERVNDPEINPEPVSLGGDGQTAVSSASQSIDEVCIDPTVDPKGTISTSDANDISSDLQLTSSGPSKSQDLQDNEENNLQDVSDKSESRNLDDLLGPIISIEENKGEHLTQAVENNNVETDTLTLTENSESCTTETDTSNTCNNQSILNVSETDIDSEKTTEENTDGQNKECNLQEETVSLEQNVSANAQEVLTTPKSVEDNCDNLIESCNDKTVATASEIATCALNENSNVETENVNEETCEDISLKFEAQCEKESISDTTEQLNAVEKEERLLSAKEHRGSQRRRESERSNKSSNEETNCTPSSASSTSGTTETLKAEEIGGRKSSKRKRGSSRTPLRRSSRYTEEITKRIKVEVDTSGQTVEQEPQEKNVEMQFLNVAPTLLVYDEETESTPTNAKKNRGVQKAGNRKRCMPLDVEILPSQSASNYESLKDVKRCKQHTVPAIMNCEVRLVDSRHTILKPNVDPNVLRKYGISAINSYVRSNSAQVNNPSSTSSMQSTPAKDSSSTSTKQASKSVKKPDDTTRLFGDQVSLNKVRKGPNFAKASLSPSIKEKGTDPDVQVMPVLTREQVVVDISQDCEKPDVEIVDEKMIVTKNQPHNDSGSTLTVIETKDDKEPQRTQYTVHKGPVLDIKVFENSFLAASEDGRIYRYSQASNGILNIYKGHQAAVTCLHVPNANGADVNKEWMFSGSLDGTLRCYNITTGAQVRDTADIGSPIQCMDEAWGVIFIGTKSGHVLRYHMKSGIMKGSSIQFSDKSVLALKATNEGPRKVLIVASRSQPITIRDAQTGLFLRTICGQKSPTVYSLMRDHNLIYCGTSSTSILVFDFTNGEQMMQYDAGVGIVCMRLYKQLLFAGCYDGNIYVFNTKDYRLVCSIPGPGNMLLSMEVIDNKIIAGSKDKRLQSWQMSRQVRSLL